MDKVEYKIRADEIKALIGEGRYAEAVKIADTIDWKRVRNVTTLCTISDLYKINRRLQESKDILLMAYDRHPTGRPIVYSLCELAIKMGEFVQAVEYYKEFVRIAPRDTGRYILQYKLYEAQEVSLEERIAVLEEFKKHDYREKWAYELAYLYHRVGLTTECIEECDEMFLWFGEGRYVMKALELKALHEPLSPEQQDRYIRYKQSHGGMVDASIVSEKDEVGKDETRTVEIKQPTKEMPTITDSVIEAYAQGNAEVQDEELGQTREFVPGEVSFAADDTQQKEAEQEVPKERDFDEIVYPHISEIKEPSVDVSTYNTINLQESLAESLREVIGDEAFDTPAEPQAEKADEPVQPITEEIFEDTDEIPKDMETGELDTDSYAGEMESVEEETAEEGILEEKEISQETGGMQEVFFDTSPKMGIEIKYGGNGPILGQEKKPDEEALTEDENESAKTESIETDSTKADSKDTVQEPSREVKRPFVYEEKPLEDEVPGAVIHPNAAYQMHSHFENMLAQESDGQISLAVEPEPEVEKQITGQISIAEYLDNWEQFKKDQQQKQLERVKKRVADETGDMFADFDEKTKAGLQERIEKAINDAIKKESYAKASGRGNWNVKKEDVINAAVAEVIENENIEEPEQVPDYKVSEADDTAAEIDTSEIAKEAVEDVTTDIPAEQVKEEVKESESTEDTLQEEATIQDDAAEPEDTSRPEDSSEPEDTSKPEDSTESEEDEDEEDDEDKEPQKSEQQNEEPKKTAVSPKKPDGKKHIGNRELEERVRTMTPEEKELFGPYIHHKKSRRQIINAIDNLSMDPFSGNAIVTGEEGAGTVNLAKGLIKAMQASDSNFSGKVAKITANTLNKKSTASIFDKLANGALIIQRAADMTQETVSELLKILQEENKGLVLVMEDTKEDMDRFLDKNPSLKQSFNVRVDIEALDDDSLVAYARQYALEKEYSIDNLGILALHTRISERQTLDHDVTVSEVKDIVDDAIYFAEKRTVGHFVDVLVHKRYDENDMIILREKDFMHD